MDTFLSNLAAIAPLVFGYFAVAVALGLCATVAVRTLCPSDLPDLKEDLPE